MKLEHLINQIMGILKKRKYTEKTWKHAFRNGRFSSLRTFFELNGTDEFNVVLANEYITTLKSRYENRELSYSRFAHLRKLALWFIAVYETGALPQKILIKSKITINTFFEDMLNSYLKAIEGRLSPSNVITTKSDVLHFIAFLEDEKNYDDFSDMTLKDMHDFVIFTRQRRQGRIDRVIHSIRYFLMFLKDNAVIEHDLTPSLYLPTKKSQKILAGFSHDEVNSILAQPDRNSPVGKRDYAILLLGKTTGLRIGDIINLKRTDIDWKNDTVYVSQRKTGVLLTLPLTMETENAIVDYLQNARPSSDLPFLFLRHNAPCETLSQQGITTLFTRYSNAAGINHTPGDGKSFHGLRRSIASWMLESDIPLTTISQILGHRQIDSTNRYISIDERNLKKCTLTLKGIEVTAEGLR